jgi:hypothetical protein
VVLSGIDRATYPPPAGPESRPWRWRVVTTGRFDPRKGFETVIRALPLLPEATLACWGRGGGEEQARLQRLAEEHGVADRVRFGSLERAELPAAYADADVMVFPSTWAEPFGLVPVEAMACGTPVVATRVGGSAEFLHDGGNCLAVPPADPGALAAAIRRLAGDEALRRRLVTGGQVTAELLDVERLADVMEAWHAYEATGHSGPRPATRPGVPETAAGPVTLQLVGTRQAVLEAGAAPDPSVRVDPRSLPIRSAALDALELRTEGDVIRSPLGPVVAEAARIVRDDGELRITGPNPRDARLLRDRARAWWRGWRRRVGAAEGALDVQDALAAVRPYGSVVRTTTGDWSRSTGGRVASAVLRLARISDVGPRTEVVIRRRR